MSRFILLLLIVFNSYCYSNNKAIEELNKFKQNPNNYIAQYTNVPKEASINSSNIKEQSLHKAYNDETSIVIRNSFNQRPDVGIHENSFAKSNLIITNADSIVTGISNEYIDCRAVKNCQSQLNDKIEYCTATPAARTYQCSKSRNVDVVIPNKVNKTIKVQLTTNAKYGGRYQYNLKTQTLIYNDGGVQLINQDAHINDISCNNFNFKVLSTAHYPGSHTADVSIGAYQLGDCNNPVVDIHIGQGGNYHKYKYALRGVVVTVYMESQDSPVVTDSFASDCAEINKRIDLGLCTETKNVCVEPNASKVINGVEVTRDCWRYESSYGCGVSNAFNNCSSLDARQCLKIGTECTKFNSGICIEQRNSYRCFTKKCEDNSNIICGDAQKILCLDGNCVDKASPAESSFSDSAAKLSVISQAIKNTPESFTEDTRFIFPGQIMSCRKSSYGFSDCCKNKGWGQDLELVKCSDEEKALGLSKQDGRAIFINKYNHKNSDRSDEIYCVFDSKIAKIIQEQGRHGQLSLTFGAGKHPDCGGISPNQLAKINIDKINLSDAFADAIANHKGENLGDNKKLLDKIQAYYTDKKVGNA
ncbi:MAG: conjugal transfer protein TraN [Rickettsiaceae bacterium]|nr:conjugal transfer protein TraN [Rickettsiaceae bacterium]